MQKTMHTKGPWIIDAELISEALCRIRAKEDGEPIADVFALDRGYENPDHEQEEATANARLIAAAPDLLAYAEMSEALGEYHRDGSGFTSEMVLAVLSKHGYSPLNNAFPGGEWVRKFRSAAIAKAKGQ